VAAAKALAARGGHLLGGSLRDLEDDGTAFSAARRLGYADLDALYEAVGRGDLAPDALAESLTSAVGPD
jgi:hypothetical protein